MMASVGGTPDTAAVIEETRDIMDARGGATVDEMLDRDFTFALDLLVAGIEAMVERSGPAPDA